MFFEYASKSNLSSSAIPLAQIDKLFPKADIS